MLFRIRATLVVLRLMSTPGSQLKKASHPLGLETDHTGGDSQGCAEFPFPCSVFRFSAGFSPSVPFRVPLPSEAEGETEVMTHHALRW
ncbi:unnamed protein product [Heligmosomoides polygyrus]|uniref:Secreted protein n=1 Tax=Heligmosomoides polygyrus TaxID=6339 RepID=A0A183GPG0_HELPZ|nr:unnamed protein product [Heligmosomoides polygyrus]